MTGPGGGGDFKEHWKGEINEIFNMTQEEKREEAECSLVKMNNFEKRQFWRNFFKLGIR